MSGVKRLIPWYCPDSTANLKYSNIGDESAVDDNYSPVTYVDDRPSACFSRSSDIAARPNVETGYHFIPLSRLLEVIRLLLKVFSTTTSEGEIQGQLHEFSLESRPSYLALSYCWGKQTLGNTVRMNGQSVQITQNCQRALEHVRQTEGHNHLVWVDQVCINQENLDEKRNQVEMMRDIYGAEKVLLWSPEQHQAQDSKFHERALHQVCVTCGHHHLFLNGSGGTLMQKTYVCCPLLDVHRQFSSRYKRYQPSITESRGLADQRDSAFGQKWDVMKYNVWDIGSIHFMQAVWVLARKLLPPLAMVPGGIATAIIYNSGHPGGHLIILTDDRYLGPLDFLKSQLIRCPDLGTYIAAVSVYTGIGLIFVVLGQRYWKATGLVLLLTLCISGSMIRLADLVEILVVGGYLSLLFSVLLDLCIATMTAG